MGRPLLATIDLQALRRNYQLARSLSASGQALAVIKANAYGHGALEVARALQDLAPGYAVACIEEADSLRQAGIRQPILLLEGFFSADEILPALAADYALVIHSDWQLQALQQVLKGHTGLQPLKLWIKVDSGMHRLGYDPAAVPLAINHLRQLPCPVELGLVSHFARADELDQPHTLQQLQQVLQLSQLYQLPVSLANSAALLHWSEARIGWSRPGILLYGASPFTGTRQPAAAQELQAVMSLTSQLISVKQVKAGEAVGYGGRFVLPKDGLIGIVACGYGDGYPRQADADTPVLVRGQRCQLAGRVSMDMLAVDLGSVPDARVGDPVELWGKNLPVNEVAAHCQTIGYTLLTGITGRVPRHYCV